MFRVSTKGDERLNLYIYIYIFIYKYDMSIHIYIYISKYPMKSMDGYIYIQYTDPMGMGICWIFSVQRFWTVYEWDMFYSKKGLCPVSMMQSIFPGKQKQI